MSVTDADRLRGKRVPITTIEGDTVELFYDMEALAEIEDEFGSIGGMSEAFGGGDAETMTQRKFIRPLLKLIKIGLAWNPAYAGARFGLNQTSDLAPAFFKAFNIGMPEPDPQQAQTNGATNESTGPISTTSLPLVSDAVTTNSGA